MATIKLTKVNIGPTRYIVYDSGTPTEVTADVFRVVDMEANVVYNYSAWSKKIGFDTPTKELSDKQYATQTNGYHWVKIPGYKVYKIPPEYISKDILSQGGVNYIQTNSEAE